MKRAKENPSQIFGQKSSPSTQWLKKNLVLDPFCGCGTTIAVAVAPSMVRDLKGTLKSQNADFGILITFRQPTRGMISEAVKEGHFEFMGNKIPKIQFLTVEDLFKELEKEQQSLL